MDDLIEFLRAALAEDERAARAAAPRGHRWGYVDATSGPAVRVGAGHAGDPDDPDDPEWRRQTSAAVWQCDDPEDGCTELAASWEAQAEHIARWDPTRVLAEVGAKRRIIEAVERYADPHPGVPCTNEVNPYDSCELHVAAQETNVNPYVLRILSLPYAAREGYRPEWLP